MGRLRSIVAAPPLEPAPYGLLNSAYPLTDAATDTDERWANGFSLESEACNVTVKNKDLCDDSNQITVVNFDTDESGDEPVRSSDYDPFTVEVEDHCGTFGLNWDDRYARLDRQLEAATQFAVEREFWTGELAQAATPEAPNKYLAASTAMDVTPVPGTAVKVKFGLALLEGALGSCNLGTIGMIHADRATASALGAKDVDGVLRSPLGTVVVAGAGYTGTGPTGSAPTGTQQWMYATGPVMVQLGRKYFTPDQASQSLNTADNTVELKAERVAAASWDGCCHFAVLVDLALDYS